MKRKGSNHYVKITFIIWSLLPFARRDELLRYLNDELQQDIMFVDWFIQMKSKLGSQMLVCPDIVYLISEEGKKLEPHNSNRQDSFEVKFYQTKHK